MTTTIVMETKQAGPCPATGTHAELLAEITQAAAQLAQFTELERSGVCDGGGVWIGHDPLLAVARRLLTLIETIARDALVDAVLDDQRQAAVPPPRKVGRPPKS
jgi:hypothetical protein